MGLRSVRSVPMERDRGARAPIKDGQINQPRRAHHRKVTDPCAVRKRNKGRAQEAHVIGGTVKETDQCIFKERDIRCEPRKEMKIGAHGTTKGEHTRPKGRRNRMGDHTKHGDNGLFSKHHFQFYGDASVKRSHKAGPHNAGPQGLRALWNANSLESPSPSSFIKREELVGSSMASIRSKIRSKTIRWKKIHWRQYRHGDNPYPSPVKNVG